MCRCEGVLFASTPARGVRETGERANDVDPVWIVLLTLKPHRFEREEIDVWGYGHTENLSK